MTYTHFPLSTLLQFYISLSDHKDFWKIKKVEKRVILNILRTNRSSNLCLKREYNRWLSELKLFAISIDVYPISSKIPATRYY